MGLDPLRRFFEPVLGWCLHRYWYFSRGMTLGVRAMVFDGDGRVFLVRHSYVPGWHMPGGGVEKGETLLTALERELREEGNIEVSEPPVLYAVYFNKRLSRRDHVALYIVRQFRQIAPPQPNREIIDHGFFAPGELPADTSRATRARISEVLGGLPPSELW